MKEGDVFTIERVDTMALALSEQNAANVTTDRRAAPSSTPAKSTATLSTVRPATTIIFTHNSQELSRCPFPSHASINLPAHLESWFPHISLSGGVTIMLGRVEAEERVKGESMRRADQAATWMQAEKKRLDAAEEQTRLCTVDCERREREILALTEQLRLTSASDFQQNHLARASEQREATRSSESAARARYDAIHAERLRKRKAELAASNAGMELGGRTKEEEKLLAIKHAQEDDLWSQERASMEAELTKQRQSAESALKADETHRLGGEELLRQRQIEQAQVKREEMERKVRWEEVRRARQERSDEMVRSHEQGDPAIVTADQSHLVGRAIPTSLRDSIYSVPPRRELLTSGIYLLHRRLPHPTLGDMLALSIENQREDAGVLAEIDLGKSVGLELHGPTVQRALLLPRSTETVCVLTPSATSSASLLVASSSEPSPSSPIRSSVLGGYSLKYTIKLETREVDQEQREARIRKAHEEVQQAMAATKQLNVAPDAAVSDLLSACSTSLPLTSSGVSVGWCDTSFPPGWRSLGVTNEQAARKGVVWRRATTIMQSTTIAAGASVGEGLHSHSSAAASISSLQPPPVPFGCVVDAMEIVSHDWTGGGSAEVLEGIFAVLASRPSLLEKIFSSSNSSLNPSGVYSLHLCVSGHWTPVILDDFLPCFAESGEPAYMGIGATTGAIWPALLEKALAKVFGSYSALSRALSPSAVSLELIDALFQTLTGCSVKSLSTRGVPAKQPQALTMTPSTNTSVIVPAATAGGPDTAASASLPTAATNGSTPTVTASNAAKAASTSGSTTSKVAPIVASSTTATSVSPRAPLISVSEPLWSLLQKEATSEQLIWGTSLTAEELHTAPAEVKMAFSRFALRAGCSYAINRVVQLPPSVGGGARLVQFSNLHSLPPPSSGAWSDASSLWSREVRSLVKPGLDAGKSGQAWMEYAIALGVFSRFSACTLLSPRSLPFQPASASSFAGTFSAALPFAPEQMYTVDVPPNQLQGVSLNVTLDQSGGLEALQTGKTVDLGLLLVSRDPKTGAISRILFDTPLTSSNQVVATCDLTPGQYLLLPYTSGTGMLQHLEGRAMEYTLTVRSDSGGHSGATGVKVIPVPSDTMLIDSAVVATMSQRSGPPPRVEGLAQGLTLITGDGDGGRLRSYAVRLSPLWTESVTVSMDCSASVNTSSHRGDLSHTQTLAPGEAVLFHHLTPTQTKTGGWTIEADIQWQ